MKISPMLCKLGSKDDISKKGYIFEPKLDGTRAICYFNKGKIKLINRRDNDITHRYPEFDFKKNINAESCILDGEIIVYDYNGNPNFNLLQKRDQLSNKSLIKERSKEIPATFVVFDILKKGRRNLTNLPLEKRKEILSKTLKTSSETIDDNPYTSDGKRLWEKIKKRHLEGIVAKKKGSKYQIGKRSSSWIKIKFEKTIDCVIIGYTSEKRKVSALAIGVYNKKNKLQYIGRVGTGFNEKEIHKLSKKLEKIETKKAPVKYSGRKAIKWVKPKLVCEVKFLEFTKDNILRAPSYLRLRHDKKPKQCKLEEQKP